MERTPHDKRTGQTKADAASCPLDAIGEDRPGPWCAPVVSTGGRAGRRLHRTPSGHHLHSGADVIRHQNAERESRPGTTSRRRATPERTETGRAAPNEGGTRPSCGSSRSIPRNDRSPVGTPSTHWWRHASRDRTHRSARDWQRYVVGKVLLSPRTAKGSRRRRWWCRDLQGRGSPCREAPAISDLECWRDPTEREVRMSLSVGPHAYATASRPEMKDLNCTNTCTKCDADSSVQEAGSRCHTCSVQSRRGHDLRWSPGVGRSA